VWRVHAVLFGVAVGLIAAACGTGQNRASTSTVRIQGSQSAQANRYDHFEKLEETYLIEGTVVERRLLQVKDDPNRPPQSSFDLKDLSSEERAALARATDEAPVMYWEVRVSERVRGPQNDQVEDVIYVTRQPNDEEWGVYKRTGQFPLRFAELDEGATFEFALIDDRFRRRAEKADRFAFFVLTGWRPALAIP
jgi:hypothetical protein